jgi:hypothetical protein
MADRAVKESGMQRMMRLALAVVTVLGCAKPASAWWGDGWLERLSGPGKFETDWRSFAPRLVCIGRPAEQIQENDPRIAGTKRIGIDDWAIQATPRIRLGITCHPLPPDKPRLEVGFTLEPFHSNFNPLPYPASVRDDQKQVDFRMLILTADARLHRAVDVGIGWGPRPWNTFRSHRREDTDPELFPKFNRAVVQFPRLNVRPLALVNKSRPAEILVLRLNGVVFMDEFTAADFGATGTFRSRHEFLWSWGMVLDFTSMFR